MSAARLLARPARRQVRRPVTASLALAAVLVAGLGGCTGDDSEPAGESQAPSSIPASGEAEPIPEGDQGAPQALPELATASGAEPGTKLTVHELRRSDEDTVRLVFTVANHGPGQWVFLNRFTEPGLVRDKSISEVSGAYLIDQAANLKYLVLRDTENACICSERVPTVLNEDRQFTAFAEFPAPPEKVKSVTVVVPLFNPMQDVPISS